MTLLRVIRLLNFGFTPLFFWLLLVTINNSRARVLIPPYLSKYPTIEAAEGAVLLSQGQACENALVLASGRLRVIARSPEGRELLLYKIEPEQFCVLSTACLLGQDPFPAEVVCESAITAHVLPQQDFRRLITEHKAFQQSVFQGFSHRLYQLMAQIETVTLTQLKPRLWEYLLNSCKHKGSQTLDLTHQEIAIDIGSSREVISRQLKSLEKEGLLELARGQITLLDIHRNKSLTTKTYPDAK